MTEPEQHTEAPLPAISELKVEGLLSFGSETVFKFGRLNILVGPNGCGKSNLLDIIRILQCTPTNIRDVFADVGFESWLFQGAAKIAAATIETIVNMPRIKPLQYHLELGTSRHSVTILDERIDDEKKPGRIPRRYFHGHLGVPSLGTLVASRKADGLDDYDPDQSILAQLRDSTRYLQITRLGEMYSRIRIYSDWSFGRSSPLREATTIDRSDTVLSEAMTDLPLVLNGLQGTPAHESIKRWLCELKPSYRDYITRILFGRVGLEVTESPFQRTIPAKRLSDGTLRFLALAAILLNPDPPPLVCIEEPELGMHPDMVRMTADMLVSASERTQLIITTHSEALLTALEEHFDKLFAFNWGPNGSVVQELTRSDYEEFRSEYPLGQLWSSGELGGVRW